MSDYFGNLFSGIFGSGTTGTMLTPTDPNIFSAGDPMAAMNRAMDLTSQGVVATPASGTDWASKLKGIGDTLKGGGGAGGGLTQLPQGQPQSLPSGAPVHQGGDLNQLMQLLQQRRNLLLSLGKPGQGGGGGGLLGM